LKNKIGAFYQPKLVISDIAVLRTLPGEELANGLAEVIKSAMIWDRDLFDYLEANLNEINSQQQLTLEEIIFKSVKIKAEVVEKDEKDLGLRNILNYGHTLGHAIESAADFGIKHGEAVAIGMLIAASISTKIGMLGIDDANRLRKLIERANLPTELPKLNLKRVIQAVRHDKKILSGKIRFILPKTIGDVVIKELDLSLVEQVLMCWNEKA
jgi:3-dehydroquinate synthase